MSTPTTATTASPLGGLPTIDVNEYGGKKDGTRQQLNRRMFMQLLVFEAAKGDTSAHVETALVAGLKAHGVAAVVYADLSNPRATGLLTWSEDPADFVTKVRPVFGAAPLFRVKMARDFSMIGRSYSTGHEPDLEHALIHRLVGNVTNPDLPWHVWYPLRRSGAFTKLEGKEQSDIMREHAQIGMAYGQQELAHDVRLACHALDGNDNDFLIGLVGRALHPLSHLVQTMRKTRQTSEFITKMGPFFVGHVTHRVG